ncbi:alpha/beta fold hydrolase [Halobellus limi]|uniref:Alpha/beta fold hydrolase n=1 Tax=Halobellus limi TaxID=699433 RepID=A0A1H5WCI7_9EURY|nr:alpha/beta fold hydrolase [Halobellus limi]QCC46484.1 alpha/beta fold hydrolase [Halobellus limi]SEF97078.1 Pimeloyl-ACP methyl ester carboxylesterase [Halobellus limi]
MARTSNGDVSLYYETAGSGPTVAFVGDVGYGAWQWGWQHAAVAGPYESLVADLRGTGRSDAPAGPYAVGDLVEDLTTVLSDAGVRSAHVVGAGLGGAVALEAARTTSRVDSLFLLGTAARGTGIDLEPLWGDPDDADALERSLAAGLSASFVDAREDAVAQMVEWRSAEDADRPAWEAQAAAVDGFDVSDRLYEITVPALAVHGRDDAVWPPERGEKLAEGLPRGGFRPIENAGHLVHVEASKRVNDELLGFLADREDD